MDDKPAIEFHPFGYITLNFDDPIQLRRCRLGDLKYAKDLLEEIRVALDPERQALVDEINERREGFTALAESVGDREQTAEETAQVREGITRVVELREGLDKLRVKVNYDWLTAVAKRMGDKELPDQDEWPVEILLTPTLASDVISHWQSVPLASGKTLGQNRTTPDQNSSGPRLAAVSSPPEPQPQ